MNSSNFVLRSATYLEHWLNWEVVMMWMKRRLTTNIQIVRSPMYTPCSTIHMVCEWFFSLRRVHSHKNLVVTYACCLRDITSVIFRWDFWQMQLSLPFLTSCNLFSGVFPDIILVRNTVNLTLHIGNCQTSHVYANFYWYSAGSFEQSNIKANKVI